MSRPDARTARSFGAEGIGLARSEHMFFSPERMVALRRMILSEDEEDRSRKPSKAVVGSHREEEEVFGKAIDPKVIRRNLGRVRERAGEDVDVLAATKYVPPDEMGALVEAGISAGSGRLASR